MSRCPNRAIVVSMAAVILAPVGHVHVDREGLAAPVAKLARKLLLVGLRGEISNGDVGAFVRKEAADLASDSGCASNYQRFAIGKAVHRLTNTGWSSAGSSAPIE